MNAQNKTTPTWLWRVLLAAALAAVMTGCASGPPKPVKARMTVAASEDANPDATGRPSPVVVRVYQLKQDAKFANADFFALFDKEQETLGADLLARDEVTLVPGERNEVEFEVKGDAKFLGVVAAFRDIRNAKWRALQPAPSKGLLNLVKKDAITIEVGASNVALTIKD